MKTIPGHNGLGIGASLLRKEDARHLRGRGQFVSDIRLPGTHEAVFVRSPHANARIRSVSVPPEARGRVFTAADLPRLKPIRVVNQSPGVRSPDWWPLATTKARFVGEASAGARGPRSRLAPFLLNYRPGSFELT